MKTRCPEAANAGAGGGNWPGWPHFEQDEIDAAGRVLKSGRVNYWTGEEGRLFEREFARYCGCRHAVAVANGTVALELALLAVGIGDGDEVVVPSRTFIASASSVVMRGARPIFADVDPVTQNITAETIRAVLTPRVKAVVLVHLAGWPCDLEPIIELAREHRLKVVEDCAQAHGAEYRGRKVGSWGDAAAFSFCQDKIMTTGGEGGMLTTSDPEIWRRAWSFKDHGKSYDGVYHVQHPPGFRWLHESFGTNWRLTEMQAAIGRVVLEKLDGWLETRRRYACRLDEALGRLPALRVASPPAETRHSYYKYYTFIRPEKLKKGWNRDRIMDAISACGVPCFSGSCSEIYREKAFAARDWVPSERIPVARELGETSLMFQVHPTLTDNHIELTANVVTGVLGEATAASSL